MLTLVLAAALASGDAIHDFGPADAARFTCVNDTVMGGRSAARVRSLEDGILRFAGTLSMENNGGFTSMQARGADYAIPDSDGLEIRVRGDGRTYTFSLDIAGVPIPAGGYWQEFSTQVGAWVTIRLPYADFVPTSFGRLLGGLPAVTPDRIDGLAVYLADKQPGAFVLDFDSIGTYRDAGPSAVTASDDSGLLPAECSTLAGLLAATGLDAAVADLDGFTLFAPTDAAFERLPSDVTDALLRPENVEALRKVLLHHVVASPVTAWTAAGLDQASVLDGGTVAIERSGATLRVGGALVVTADRLRGQGVVHVIDAVIVPADLTLAPSASGVTSVLLDAISRGVPLYNAGNVEACAAVYRTAVEATLALSASDLDAGTVAVLRDALARSEHQGARTAAWTLRRAMDTVLNES
jgi:uncharacterized surface protein with fasciclin (FAS1) repeats